MSHLVNWGRLTNLTQTTRKKRDLIDVDGVGEDGRGTNLHRISLLFERTKTKRDDADDDINNIIENEDNVFSWFPITVSTIISLLVICLVTFFACRRQKKSTVPSSRNNTMTVVAPYGNSQVSCRYYDQSSDYTEV